LAATWQIEANQGLDTAWVTLGEDRLNAHGRAVGLKPEPYWLVYDLETGPGFVTRRLMVVVEGQKDTRSLNLNRHDDGSWSANGRRVDDVGGALDCDLGLCPLTNSMPILRHRLHRNPGSQEFVMAWVAVPDLTVHRSRQFYEHLRRTPDGALVRYEGRDGTFTADLVIDQHGLVVRYPTLGHRIALVLAAKSR